MATDTTEGKQSTHTLADPIIKTADFANKLRQMRDKLTEGLVERDVAVRLALLAALAGEHLLLIGPPGTAKSLVARRLHLAFADSAYFERLLTRFSVPEELFGPLSIRGLEEDRYQRLTDAYLPKASIAFLDEIFKANSAILNALLTLLNEREFDNGILREKTPLAAVIGASNELPEGEELDALFDRFLLRLYVGPVTKEAFPELLGLRGHAAPAMDDGLKLRASELRTVQEVAADVEVPPDVVALLCDLRDWCTAEGINVSDRRWRKVVKLLQVSALTNGRNEVSIWDCWLLQHCLWDDPDQRDGIYDWYAARVGAAAAMDPSRLTKIVVAWEAQLKKDQESRSQVRDEEGRPLYVGPSRKPTTAAVGMAQAYQNTEPLFLAPANAESGHYQLIADRTNGGKGYTRAQLNELRLRDPHWGGRDLFQHWEGRDAYLAERSNWLMTEVSLQPVLEPTRHKGSYIRDCTEQLDQLHHVVQSYQQQLLAHVGSLETAIRGHLWVTPEFVGPAAASLEQTGGEVKTLLARVTKVRKGFEALPGEIHASTALSGSSVSPAIVKKGRCR